MHHEYEGIRNVDWERRGQQATMHLGTVHLTRLIVISSDAQLRQRLRSIYETQFAAKVARLVKKVHSSNYMAYHELMVNE